jgi:hypothetical protein
MVFKKTSRYIIHSSRQQVNEITRRSQKPSRDTEVPARQWPHFSTRHEQRAHSQRTPPTAYTPTTHPHIPHIYSLYGSCQPHSAHSPLTEHDAWHTCCSARCPHTGTSLPRQGPGPILDLFSHFYHICGTIRSRLRRRGDSVKKEEIYYRILNL